MPGQDQSCKRQEDYWHNKASQRSDWRKYLFKKYGLGTDEADEIINETFVGFVRRWDKIEGDTNVYFRKALNFNTWRNIERSKKRSTAEQASQILLDLEKKAKTEAHDMLHRILDQADLDVNEREILAKCLEGYNQREIADCVGRKHDATRKTYAKLIGKLRKAAQILLHNSF